MCVLEAGTRKDQLMDGIGSTNERTIAEAQVSVAQAMAPGTVTEAAALHGQTDGIRTDLTGKVCYLPGDNFITRINLVSDGHPARAQRVGRTGREVHIVRLIAEVRAEDLLSAADVPWALIRRVFGLGDNQKDKMRNATVRWLQYSIIGVISPNTIAPIVRVGMCFDATPLIEDWANTANLRVVSCGVASGFPEWIRRELHAAGTPWPMWRQWYGGQYHDNALHATAMSQTDAGMLFADVAYDREVAAKKTALTPLIEEPKPTATPHPCAGCPPRGDATDVQPWFIVAGGWALLPRMAAATMVTPPLEVGVVRSLAGRTSDGRASFDIVVPTRFFRGVMSKLPAATINVEGKMVAVPAQDRDTVQDLVDVTVSMQLTAGASANAVTGCRGQVLALSDDAANELMLLRVTCTPNAKATTLSAVERARVDFMFSHLQDVVDDATIEGDPEERKTERRRALCKQCTTTECTHRSASYEGEEVALCERATPRRREPNTAVRELNLSDLPEALQERLRALVNIMAVAGV